MISGEDKLPVDKRMKFNSISDLALSDGAAAESTTYVERVPRPISGLLHHSIWGSGCPRGIYSSWR